MQRVTVVLLVTTFSLMCVNTIPAQMNSLLEDSTIVFENKDGKRLSLEEVKSILNQGQYKMMDRRNMETGIRRIILSLPDSIDAERWEAESNRRIAVLKGKSLFGSQFIDMGGKAHTVGTGGKLVVVNCWFVACKPCVDEMPLLNAIVRDYRNENVQFLALSRDDSASVALFMKNHEFAYPIVPSVSQYLDDLGVEVYPTHMIIDTAGIVREVIIGKDESLDLKVRNLIDQFLRSMK